MNLPDPKCKLGYTAEQITSILGGDTERFWFWMRGQTMGYCEGVIWNESKREYEKSCEVAHHDVVYPYDLKRFMKGLPCID